jgi:cyanate permease
MAGHRNLAPVGARLRNTLIAIALTTCFTAASQASTSADVPSVSQDHGIIIAGIKPICNKAFV